MAEENNLSQSFWGRFQLALQPSLLWQMIKEINSYGPWVADGEKISGFFVWTSWVVESFGVLFLIFSRLSYADDNPFSEEDQSWHEKTTYGPLQGLETEGVLKAVKDNNPAFFKEIEFTEKGNSDYSQLITYTCLRGQDYLSLQHFVANVDRGRVNYDEKGGLQLLAIDKSISAILQNNESESQEQQVVVAEVGSIDSPVVAEEYKVNESEIIQPQIGFKYNKTFELGSILYALMGLGFGIMLLYTSTLDYMEDKALSLIGGIIFTGVGVASIGAILFSKSVSKNRIVLKVNSSFIEFDPAITGNKKLIIPFNYLKGIEHYRNESGTVGLSFLCKDEEMFGTDLLNMGVSSVDTNSVILANELQKCIGLEADKRQEQIEDWAKRKPSLLV